jgi:arsenite/tail-anchored protein-transporting ATPase
VKRVGGRHRFTFFGGKGGVGKTTCAAAAAARAADEGRRVLVVSTDPAHSLGDALGLRLGAKPRPVSTRRGRLEAVQLDADRALVRWMREREDAFRTVAERGTYLDDDDVDRLFSLSLPGVDELVGLVELARLAGSETWDEVVVDTAPTGHTLRLLEMPETLRRFAVVLDDMHAKHRFLATSLGGAWRTDFVDRTIDEVHDEATELSTLLTDAGRTSFTWITLAERMAIEESEDGVRALESLGVAVPVVVVNRLWPSPEVPCALCTPRALDQAACVERVRQTFAGKTLLGVTAAVREPRGALALRELARSVRPLAQLASQPQRSGRGKLSPAAVLPGRPSTLRLPTGVRLVLFGGKGGVGKTTAAAAAALELAEASPASRVLLLSTDPAHSLGDALGATFGDVPRGVPGGPPNLRVQEMDAKKELDRERERYQRTVDELFSSIFRGRMDAAFDRAVLRDLLDLAPPGLDELFAIVTLRGALFGDRRTYERVVIDTAPTGHTLRLLALPKTALEWVHAIMRVILKYRSVIGLGDFAADLTRFARDLRELVALLADPERTAFFAVARPAELPRAETARLVTALRRGSVPLGGLVINAVTPPSRGCARCEDSARAESPEIGRLAQLASRAGVSVHLAPALHPPPRGPSALRTFRRAWREPFLAQ